ncbi:hypothetical protein KBD75_03165 [Candidatus Woesebacteria bacterium]|nr:hypothetical protein [Candidatus Woesebacteria bacterium]
MKEISGTAPPHGDRNSRLRFRVVVKVNSPFPPLGWTASIEYHPDRDYTLPPPDTFNVGYHEGANFYTTQQDLLTDLIYLYGLTPSGI